MTTIKEIVASFLFVRRLEGWRSALATSWKYLHNPIFVWHLGFALRKSLRGEIDLPVPEVDLTIRQATLDDLALLGTIFPPLRLKRIARKLQAGEKCVIAIQEQKAIAYVFAAFAGNPSTTEVQLDLGPGEAYIWAGYALPAFRRLGVVRAINLHLCRLLQKEGYEKTVLLVDASNKVSLGHCKKTGYRITDRVAYLQVLGWKWSQSTPVEPPV